MGEYWSSSDVVAWTDHDGPQRPPTGLPTSWYRGLAGAFGAWFVLAVIGCEVIHHSGGDHVAISPAETIGAAAVFLGLPAMAVLLVNREVSGAWLAALLGGVACAISLTQWSIVPAYTALEAGGFAILGLCGLALGIAQRRSRPRSSDVADRSTVPATGGLAEVPPARPADAADEPAAVR
jgi:hypothetical protein